VRALVLRFFLMPDLETNEPNNTKVIAKHAVTHATSNPTNPQYLRISDVE
jgi:hypothetical protein